MKCSEVEERLNAYLDNLLHEEERDLMEKHCAQCSLCSRSLRDLKKTTSILEELDEIEPPSWLADKVMARIYETDTKKRWFEHIFLPLRIKVPIQALAMMLVVVLSVYVYRSTAPEPGNLRPPGQVPEISREVPPSTAPPQAGIKEKKELRPEPGLKQSAKKMNQQPEIAGQTPKAATEELKVQQPPGGADRPDGSRLPSAVSEKDTFTAGTYKREYSASSAAPAPLPERVEQYKTRGMAARKEKASDSEKSASEISRDMPLRIFIESDDPPDAASRVRDVLVSLAAGELHERTENNTIILSGIIDPKQASDLKTKIGRIARVREFRASPASSGLIEIVIARESAVP